MAMKFEIKKSNENNFSLWKMKKAILTKEDWSEAIGERPAKTISDIKLKKTNDKAIANLHLSLADEVLSNVE